MKNLQNELEDWDKLSDEALEEFDFLVDQPEVPENMEYWTESDWLDWLMGK